MPSDDVQFSSYIVKAAKRDAGSRGRLYTTSEVADLLGYSPAQVKRWRRNAVAPQPTFAVERGQLTVKLYTTDDLKQLRSWASQQKPGRKPKPTTNGE